MTVDDLYGVPPDEFLAVRKELVAAAKARGDAEAAKSIGAARRPTAAAWVVNLLMRRDGSAKSRLKDLGEELRAAHAAMDGPRIRELTGVQRKLIDGLVRAGLAEAGYAEPSAALRNDVTDTLQAAIADPDVAARLGRLEKAERWSGFGEFGSVTAAGPVPKAAPKSNQKDGPVDQEAAAAAQERRSAAVAEAAKARMAHAEAVDVVAEQRAKLAKARRQYEKLLESLDAAEREANAADERLGAAEEAEREATDRLHDAERDLAGLDPPANTSR
ncbi:hypothetical protein [Mycolicibacterium sp.]|uniref:hypothetical protein n=1 Tax=Mycolicibacterium sp. TaxID=2320850 RepID=UPI001A1D9FD5|nr:hypothetical protein [Mycolicibacterium sp.]MBJ7339466.1 hypothetical protein [Mycolicibacterium sp.]